MRHCKRCVEAYATGALKSIGQLLPPEVECAICGVLDRSPQGLR
jgi:hypothetical protein